jgi:hypothetical protein
MEMATNPTILQDWIMNILDLTKVFFEFTCVYIACTQEDFIVKYVHAYIVSFSAWTSLTISHHEQQN